ncbi:hypothetical protein ONZ45_g5133 [Pleurotus djamor]|nr:hypothetical protein ONZ45_g5133 [Pleurotus djamor]
MLLIVRLLQWFATANLLDFLYPHVGPKPFPDLYEASILELQAGLDSKQFSSVNLVEVAYLARIEEVNLRGPALRAVLEINPSVLKDAQRLDFERAEGRKRGPLHGIPVLLKDNMATIATEGKANLCEFSHARGEGLANGWSGRGGQTTGAYLKNADPCGSSSGSAVATSIGLTTVALGTETDGSITCPADYNNVVGIKPTVGLTSRAGVIPITANQDTVGPIARSVADAALVLSVIAGKDLNDHFTLSQPSIVPDYSKALTKTALAGKHLGVPRRKQADIVHPSILAAFEDSLHILKDLGATIVDPTDIPSIDEIVVSEDEVLVAQTDYKVGSKSIQLNAWYKGLISNPSGVRSMSDLIKFNEDNRPLEMPPGYEDQSYLTESQATLGFNATYLAALRHNHDLGRTRGIDAVLRKYRLDALVVPANVASGPAAIAGYPIVTVPMGFFPADTLTKSTGPHTIYPGPGIPFGLSFVGTNFSEFKLIGMAYAYEQKTRTRLEKRASEEAIPRTQIRDVL